MSFKDYGPWFERKPRINELGHRPFVHDNEVRWCSLGTNIGSEQDGKGSEVTKPVVVYRKLTPRMCLVIPLTTSDKKHALHIPIDIGDSVRRFALIHQIRSIDIKRLLKPIGSLTEASREILSSSLIQVISDDWFSKKSEAIPRGIASGPKPSVSQ